MAQLEQRLLESIHFTLQQFWYLLKPNAEMMRPLSQLCGKIAHPNVSLLPSRNVNVSAAEDIRGGQVLQIIHHEQLKNLGY